MENKYYYDNYDPELEEALQEPLLPTEIDQAINGINISLCIFLIFVFFFS
jgi:hypothetical protein